MILATIILVIVLLALAVYAVFGGADFGVGIWETFTAFRSSRRQTELSYNAIGPVWETNHVWLIFILVMLFGAFPAAFATINEALFIPLFLALVGIVFRGAAYAFRSQVKSFPNQRRLWESVFAVASMSTPLFLGACIGAIASGSITVDENGTFDGNVATGWLNSLSIFIGLFTVGMCAYSSAVLLFREATISNDSDLTTVWKRRALVTGGLMGVMAISGLILVALEYPVLFEGMQIRGWPFIVASVIAGISSIVFILINRIHLSAAGVGITCSTVIFGWGFSQYPFLVPGVWSIENARSPDSVLQLILIVTAVGLAILAPSLYLLFKIFKSEESIES